MSRGLGKIQEAILEQLARDRRAFLTTHQLSWRLNRSQQQVYRAVRSLAERGLVEITLEPNLRVWNPGATERRRSYGRSIGAEWSEKEIRRPPHCGPGCVENHVGADKQHWA